MTIVLLSPMRGWAGPLDEVPDPVFADRMLGDGVAIDPTGNTLVAPCAGQITSLASSAHAVAMRSDEGLEILMHIGVETVGLHGKGFRALVSLDQRVVSGDPLIQFDLDGVADGARSLISPVIVTNSDAFAFVWRRSPSEVEVGDTLMELRALAPLAQPPETLMERRIDVVVGLDHGVHARPAAMIAALAKSYQAKLRLEVRGRSAPLTSPIAVMGLGAGRGDPVSILAAGPDAKEAAEAVASLLKCDAAGASAGTIISQPAGPPSLIRRSPRVATPKVSASGALTLRGVVGAPGFALGVAVQWRRAEMAPWPSHRGAGPQAEGARLASSLEAVRRDLSRGAAAPGAAAAILKAHLELLDDDGLQAGAQAQIIAGCEAGEAFARAIAEQAAMLRQTGDPRIQARTSDLYDLERRVRLALSGGEPLSAPLPEKAILIADDLLPSELLALEGRLAGIGLAGGGPTSHIAIIAAGMNIPLLAALGSAALTVPDGASAILDASRGVLLLHPSAAERAKGETKARSRTAAQADMERLSKRPGQTADGFPVPVYANVSSVEDAMRASMAGAEGCGLLRTEFLFHDRAVAPDEAQQLGAYQAVADALGAGPIVIRTLDIGAEKRAPYLDLPRELNPALGLRGVRTSLWRPDLLRVQLRAIARVEPAGLCRIMIPMVASVSELREVREILEDEARLLGLAAPPLGVMIETPAAAATTAALAAEATFFSIGTNDLTQYALAMDRANPRLAASVDALHPGVIRLIALACSGARSVKAPIAVCGALASDPQAAPLLVGLGATALSTAPAMTPAIKLAVAKLTLDQCRSLAEEALACSSPQEVRRLLAAATAQDHAGDAL